MMGEEEGEIFRVCKCRGRYVHLACQRRLMTECATHSEHCFVCKAPYTNVAGPPRKPPRKRLSRSGRWMLISAILIAALIAAGATVTWLSSWISHENVWIDALRALGLAPGEEGPCVDCAGGSPPPPAPPPPPPVRNWVRSWTESPLTARAIGVLGIAMMVFGCCMIGCTPICDSMREPFFVRPTRPPRLAMRPADAAARPPITRPVTRPDEACERREQRGGAPWLFHFRIGRRSSPPCDVSV